MFQISSTPLKTAQLRKNLWQAENGAAVFFEGWVRNHNDGRAVDSLQYEAFEELAKKEAERILEEAEARFGVSNVSVVHRVGHLAIGDVAIWIGVGSAHRKEALDACHYIIDEIKVRLPIWKKEHYRNGRSEWVNCQRCAQHTRVGYSEADYYDKQLKLKNLGKTGQERLRGARALVVGAGGLGSPALTYLAAAGVGHITICDGDRLEVSNLHRQSLYDYTDIGQSKAERAKHRLESLNPFIKVDTLNDRVNMENVSARVSGYDVVLDCSDNFSTKFLLHDACYLSEIPLVQASVYQLEGQLQTFDRERRSGCLRCLWPTMPAPDCVGSCTDVGVLGVVPGLLGTMQAAEAIKILLGWPSVTSERTVLVNLQDWDTQSIVRPRNSLCPLCGDSPSIKELESANYGISEVDVDLSTLSDQELNRYEFVDIRASSERDESYPWEKFLSHQPGVKAGDFKQRTDRERVLLVCTAGMRSKLLALQLRKAGKEHVYSLAEGVDSLRTHWERVQKIQNPNPRSSSPRGN